MDWKVILTFLIMLFAAPAFAEHYEGVSSYAIMSKHYPCGQLLRVVRTLRRPAINVLIGTFGSEEKCLVEVMKEITDRPHLLEVYFSNEVCRRNRCCYAGEFLRGSSVIGLNQRLETKRRTTLSAIASRMQYVNELLAKLRSPNTRVVLSFLEDNFTKKAYANLTKEIRSSGFNDMFVRNPVSPMVAVNLSRAVELHGFGNSRPRNGVPFIVNNDGATDSGPERYDAFVRGSGGSLATFVWDRHAQGYNGRACNPPMKRPLEFPDSRVRLYQSLLK